MKKILGLLLAGIMCCTLVNVSIHAEDLDEILGDGNKTQDEIKEPVKNENDNNKEENNKEDEEVLGGLFSNDDLYNGNNFSDTLSDSTDFTNEVEGVGIVISGIKLVTSAIVQVLSYLALSLLTVRVVIDLLYIAFPFARAFLANGRTGVVETDGFNRNQGIGGYGPGAMSSIGMNSANNATLQNNNRQSLAGSIQFVSNAALNAVANESVIDADGTHRSPYGTYAKDMIFALILIPLLLVLAVSGQLANLGMAIGNILANIIQSIVGSI